MGVFQKSTMGKVYPQHPPPPLSLFFFFFSGIAHSFLAMNFAALNLCVGTNKYKYPETIHKVFATKAEDIVCKT